MTESGCQSLTQLAWQRLRRHHIAMACLAFILLVALVSFGAPVVAPDDPATTRTWIGAQPPGFRHPEVAEVNRFVVGEMARTAPGLLAARTLVFDTQEVVSRCYRVVLRGDRVSLIQDMDGRGMLQELELGAHARLQDVDLEVPPLTLRLHEPVPPALHDVGRVLLIRISDPADTVSAEHRIILEAGVVRSIDGSERKELSIPGDHVLAVLADGEAARQRHWLGTDELGRDLLTRLLYGGRISLTVGLVATLVSAVIGIIYGAVAGYCGGRTDRALMATVDVLFALPFMFLVILLLVLFGRNIIVLFAALGAVQWLTTARIVRGQVLSLRERAFIEAARMAGAGHLRIIRRHIIPNCLGPIVVYTTLTVPVVILEESFLAFIGLQVEWGGLPLDSWGALVKIGARSMDQYPWLLLAPALLMSTSLLAMNVLGDALRDAIDPQLQGPR